MNQTTKNSRMEPQSVFCGAGKVMPSRPVILLGPIMFQVGKLSVNPASDSDDRIPTHCSLRHQPAYLTGGSTSDAVHDEIGTFGLALMPQRNATAV
jgi:hypothetical protein